MACLRITAAQCRPAHGSRPAHTDLTRTLSYSRRVHNTSVVEEDVETAKLGDGSVDEVLDVGLLGHVALDGDGLRGGETLGNELGSGSDGSLVDVRKDDTGALSGELERGFETDTAEKTASVQNA